MYSTPQIEPVTTMARNHKVLLDKLKNGPVFLSQRGTEAAVMVSALEWRSIVQKLEQFDELRRKVRLERAKRAYTARRADPSKGVSQEEYEQMVAEAGLVR